MLPEVHLKEPTAEEFRDRFLYYLRYTCGLELRHARPADQNIGETAVDHSPFRPEQPRSRPGSHRIGQKQDRPDPLRPG